MNPLANLQPTVATPDLPVPPALAALRDTIRASQALGTPLRLRGGGTKDFLGGPLDGEPLDTRAFAGIVAYEPTELVVTARCGTPLAELEAELSAQGQMLAFEPPAFGAGATIGGVIAAGLSGPRRASAGAARDFVLGASMLAASGDLLHFGGQVMKNVAGYDLSRLLCGSMGVLGLITEVSLKVLPRPAAERTLAMPLPAADAIRLLNDWAGQPLPISATAWQGGSLRMRLSGARAAVDAAVARFTSANGAIELDPVESVRTWADLREQRDPFFSGAGRLWRLSVPSAAPLFELPGTQLVEWGGALRWFRTDADVATVRGAAARVGGTAMLFRGRADDDRRQAVHPMPEVSMRIQQRLKREFDPKGIFNPGRLHPEL